MGSLCAVIAALAQAAVSLAGDATADPMEEATTSSAAAAASAKGRQSTKLFGQLLQMLRFYMHFEIDETSGEALSDHEMTRYCCVHVHIIRAAHCPVEGGLLWECTDRIVLPNTVHGLTLCLLLCVCRWAPLVMCSRHYIRMQRLQRLAFRHLQSECPDLCLQSIAQIDTRRALTQHLETYVGLINAVEHRGSDEV